MPRAQLAGGHAVIEHIAVRLTVTQGESVPLGVQGEELLALRAEGGPVSELALDVGALEMAEIRRVSGPATSTAEGVADADGHLLVRFEPALAQGERAMLDIRFSGTPARGLTVAERGVIWAGFHTCDWLVCRQLPSDRPTWDLTIRGPTGTGVIAPGTPHADAGRTTLDRPTPPYQIGFVLAPGFEKSSRRTPSGTMLHVMTPAGGPNEEDRELILEATTQAHGRLQTVFGGAPMPGGSYTQVLVSGRAAQEMAGMAVIRESVVDEIRADPLEDWLVVHELAHQWWGNLVTCATWGDFWLNEGVVVWLVARHRELRELATGGAPPGAGYGREVGLWQARYDRARAAGKDRALHDPGRGVDDAGGSLVYNKGGLVVHALRMGPGGGRAEFIDQVLAATVRDAGSAGASLTTAAFQRRLQAAAPDSAAQTAAIFEAQVFSE